MPIVLTGPPSACCWSGIKHTCTPEGRVESLGGLDTYISEPPANSASGPHNKVLLFLADAYGPLFSNNKLLPDYFASRGFIILGPDYFFGVPVQNTPADRDKVAWSLEALAVAIEVFPKWFENVRATYSERDCRHWPPSNTLLSGLCSLEGETTKYIAVGYCFGAPSVLALAAGVSHGFAVRGDPNVPHARWAKEESARGITEWFFRFAA